MIEERSLVQKGLRWTLKSALVLSLSYLILVFFTPPLLNFIRDLLALRGAHWLEWVIPIVEMFTGLGTWLFLVLVVGGFFGVVPFLVIGGLTGVILGHIVSFTEKSGLGSTAYVAVAFLLSIFSLIWVLFHYLLEMLWLPAIVVPPVLIYFVACLFVTHLLLREARRLREAAA